MNILTNICHQWSIMNLPERGHWKPIKMHLNRNENSMKYKWIWALAAGTTAIAFTSSCASIPKGATAVKSFELDRYLGKWYEIARKDFKYEKNLNNVTAHYSLNNNGTIEVVNRGFDVVNKEWKESVGKAKSVGDPNDGRLKVSFFGPFYFGYNVIEIDPDYQYALVAGDNLKYLWILLRQPNIPEDIKNRYLEKAQEIGYDISDMVWGAHDKAGREGIGRMPEPPS